MIKDIMRLLFGSEEIEEIVNEDGKVIKTIVKVYQNGRHKKITLEEDLHENNRFGTIRKDMRGLYYSKNIMQNLSQLEEVINDVRDMRFLSDEARELLEDKLKHIYFIRAGVEFDKRYWQKALQ